MRTHLLAAALAAALCLPVLAILTGFPAAPLSVPVAYSGDELLHLGWIQNVVETGWWRESSRLGAPFGQDLADFPVAGTALLHVLAVKVLALFTPDAVTVMNTWFLLGFPLSALGAYAFMARLGLAVPWAIAGALLFTFLPFHLLRGTGHFLHATTVTLPLLGLASLHVLRDDETPGPYPAAPIAAGVLTPLVLAGGGGYYAAFSAYLLVIAGTTAWARTGRTRPLVRGVAIAGAVLAVTWVSLAPVRARVAAEGPNPRAVHRYPLEAEVYGLKLMNLLLPTPGHRVEAFAAFQERYALAPLHNENTTAALGAIGALGSLLLLAFAIQGRDPWASRLGLLAPLFLAGFLLATVGGGGSLIAHLVSPTLRAYNRVAPILGLLAIAASLCVLDEATRPYPRGGAVLALLVTGLGLLDQVPAGALGRDPVRAGNFAEDRRILRELEARLGSPGPVLQVPHRTFPESVPEGGIGSYEELLPFLHTRHLRTSAGRIAGRPEESWIETLGTLPVPELARILPGAGYAGVLVDRAGYEDAGGAIEEELARELGPPVGQGGRWILFRVPPEAPTPEAPPPLRVRFGAGFWPPGLPEEGTARWTRARGAPGYLHVTNAGTKVRRVHLAFEVSTRATGTFALRAEVRGPGPTNPMRLAAGGEPVAIGPEPKGVELTLDVPPGVHSLALTGDAPAVWSGARFDPRPGALLIADPSLREPLPPGPLSLRALGDEAF